MATLSPREKAPAARVSMGASIPPASTGVPGLSPESLPPSAVTSPTTSAEGTILWGISSNGIPKASAISSDQVWRRIS